MSRFWLRAAAAAGLLVPAFFLACTMGYSGCRRGPQGRGENMADDFAQERLRMVERQIKARGVRDSAVLKAMSVVPRHEFVPPPLRHAAYADHPLPLGEGQTISQPYIVALMTEALAVSAGDKVLELGTGSGYQAAVLAAIVDSVLTIEYFPSLAAGARRTLARLGIANVLVKTGDGWAGWPEHAPYDAAIVTFAAPTLPEAVIAQLRSGGRLCLPVGEAEGVQELMLYTKQDDGSLAARSLGPVRFVPVQGEGAGRGQ